MEFARNRKNPPAHPQHPTLSEIACCMLPKEHSRCRDEQKQTEKIQDEMKALHQRDTEQDHRASHDQRSDNSPNQNATLCKRRNAKMRENHKLQEALGRPIRHTESCMLL